MASALLDGLVAYWDLDEGGVAVTRVDSHTDGHDLDPVGTGVNPDTGLLNGCTRGTQNASNYLATAGHDDAYRPGASGMTINARVQIPAGTLVVNHPILAHYSNTDRGWILWGRNAVDEFAMTGSNNGTTSVTVDWGVDYLVDTWYQVTGFLDPSNDRIGIQVDRGTTVWTTLTGPFHQATEPLTHQFFSGTSGVPGGARIDELGLWNRILTDEELDTLSNSGGVPPAYSTFTSSTGGATGPDAVAAGSSPFYYYRR